MQRLEEQEQFSHQLTEGLEVHHGIAIPRHMSLPGRDGYRTPTVHDYELEAEEKEEKKRPTAGTKANRSRIDLGLERLHWRERIRHFTWTFFTMTMATGGIANVLYTGRLPSTSQVHRCQITNAIQCLFVSVALTPLVTSSSCSTWSCSSSTYP